jgi:LuxR family maltose regulon positive regulatory protein
MRDSSYPLTIKTTAPSLVGVIERPRLVNALAELPAAAKWLQSPSGSGKSTLAANFSRSRNKPFAWYRLDERDNDSAFFYQEFTQALAPLLNSTALPKFSGDDHDRHQAFSQRFASALITHLKKPVLIVLDDAQRLASSDMQRALAALIAVAVNGSELLFVSESSPPTAFFDAIAARHLALLNDADLRFDVDECKAMTAGLRSDDSQSDSIAALTGGHAGALVLACELLRGSDPKSALGLATVNRIHSHLLSKLLDGMPPQRRELLLQTAFVNQLTRPSAESLAGADAAHELDALVDSGLLRRVGVGKSEVFEAHGLVRQGTKALAHSRFGKGMARALAELTATILVDNDQREAAFELLIEVESRARAISLLEELAERYAARGHADLLLSSNAKLPPEDIGGNAWVCFWTGQALLAVNEEEARKWFENAHFAFKRSGNTDGMRLAAASVVTAFALETGDLRDVDKWIELHRNAGGETPVAAGEPYETTLIMGVACAAFFTAGYPSQIDADALIARLQELFNTEQAWFSDDQRVQAARILIEQGHVFMKYELAQTAVIATRSLIDQRVGSDLQRGRWLITAAYTYFDQNLTARSLACLNEARTIAETSQSSRLAFELGLAFVGHWMKCSDLPKAEDELRRLETVATAAPPAQRAEHARLMTRLLLLQGQYPEGLRYAQEAKRLAIPAGFSGTNLRAFDIELVYALAANDRLADAIELIRVHDYEPHQTRLAIEHCLRFLIGGKSDLQLLREGLRNAAEVGFVHLLDRARGQLVQICEAALASGVETDFVHRLILTKELRPPPLAGPHWPWPVKIKTLGGFQLSIEGQRYEPAHKAQEKPLELLKLLVTCQALGRSSPEKGWICERLWPDSEPERARKSLDMTIGRLRRLLRSDETVILNEGRLQLSPLHVWTDIGSLQRALSQTRTKRDDYVARKTAQELGVSIAAMLVHYNGPFMAEEEGPPWLLAGREAVAAAVRHALISADALLGGQADEALIPALEKALSADPTSEDIARLLMRTHLRQGHHGEAIRVYRRLRDMLSLLLAVSPSADTEHLREQAYAAESQKVDP